MELFHGVNVDWLGKKWFFLAFSMIFSVAGVLSMGWHWTHPVGGLRSPVPLSVDFRGGTQVQVKFDHAPDINKIREATQAAGIKDASVVNYDVASSNEVLISLPEQTNESALDAGRQQIVDALHAHYGDSFVIRNVQVVGPRWANSLRNRLVWRRFTHCWVCWFTSGSAFS